MSHWGEPLLVEGVTLVPRVEGGVVDTIVVTNRRNEVSHADAQLVLDHEMNRHSCKPYSKWLARLQPAQ